MLREATALQFDLEASGWSSDQLCANLAVRQPSHVSN
jgi:hypothetical protein